MTANDIAWAIGIAVPVAIFVVLAGMAAWRYLAETAPEDDTPPDPELDDEAILRRAILAWRAFAESHDYGPCRYCRIPDSECVPHVRWCCNRCADDPRAHPIVETKGGAA